MDWRKRHELLTGKKIKLPGEGSDKKVVRYVYVFQSPLFGYYKVGLATNVTQRLRQVNKSCGCKMILRWKTNVKVENPHEIMERIRMSLPGGIDGDWYDCSWEELEGVLRENKLLI